MLQNGSGSKTEHEPKVGKEKAKGKERWAARETTTPNLCATIGARGMGTVAMQQLAIFPTMVLRVGINDIAKAVKRAKKEIMAMVMEGIEGDQKEPAKPRKSNAERAS
jgi:hypothetical protein